MTYCEICGKYPAKYVCQNCGARVCTFDFNKETGLCSKCLKEVKLKEKPISLNQAPFFTFNKGFMLGFTLVFIGFILIMFSFLFTSLKLSVNKTGEVGIFIFPFFFFTGTKGPLTTLLLILTLALFLVFLIIPFVLFYRSYLGKN